MLTPPPTRSPPDGPLIGTLQASGRVEAYLGIPFAAPPVGDLRWRPPQPVKGWDSPRPATSPAPACPQSEGYKPDVGARDESCLYLNVFTPAGAPDCAAAGPSCVRRPVLVYLHGGSFINGGASEDRLNGSFTVAHSPSMLVVVAQYRLGVLGFSGGGALGGAESGNFGLQDQRAALRWVRRSILAFGGDPSRVLLGGQSAGAGSVSVHLVSPHSSGLFSRALMLSGAFGHWITQSSAQAEASLQRLGKAVGCATLRSSTSTWAVNATCLRGVDAMVLVNASVDAAVNGYGPTTSTTELADEPWALARKGGLAAGVPLMLGSTAEDGGAPAAIGGGGASAAQLGAWISSFFGPSGLNYSRTQLGSLNALYASPSALNRSDMPPVDPKGSAAYWSSIRLLADAEMACPARRAAAWRTAPNDSAWRAAPGRPAATAAYWYLWEHSPLVGVSDNMRCAYHASDIPYLFHVTQARDPQYQLNSDAERNLSSTLLGYVASFAATGAPVPSSAAAPKWPSFERATSARLLLRAAGAEGSIRLETHGAGSSGDWQARTCDAWDDIGDAKAPIV